MEKYLKGKKILSVLMAACMLLASAGCTKKNAENAQVTISVGNWPNEEADPTGYQRRMEQKAEFEKVYPNIKIEPDSWAFDVKTFMAKAEAGTLPTVYEAHFTESQRILDGGYASDVSKQLNELGYAGMINEFILDAISQDGKIYMLPNSVYTLGVVLNLDLFKQAGFVDEAGAPKVPQTFEELAQMAEEIHNKTGKAGFVFPTKSNAGGWNFMPLAWSFGVEFMEQEKGAWKATFNTEECVQALDFLKDLKWNKNAMPSNTLIGNSDTMKMIGVGEAAMAFAHPGQLPALVTSYGMNKDSIGFIKMPAGPKEHITLMGGSYYVVKNDISDEEIDAAVKWLQFTGFNPEATDSVKDSFNKSIETNLERGVVVGIADLSIWNDKATVTEYKDALRQEKMNVNPVHIASYNDKSEISYQAEPPRCAQDLYALLDSCIQEVLNNKDADSKALIEKAANDLQNNFLDYER